MNHEEISLPLLAEGSHGDREDDGSNVASKVGKRPPGVEDEIKHDVHNGDAHERNEDRLKAFGVGGVELVKPSHEFEANQSNKQQKVQKQANKPGHFGEARVRIVELSVVAVGWVLAHSRVLNAPSRLLEEGDQHVDGEDSHPQRPQRNGQLVPLAALLCVDEAFAVLDSAIDAADEVEGVDVSVGEVDALDFVYYFLAELHC